MYYMKYFVLAVVFVLLLVSCASNYVVERKDAPHPYSNITEVDNESSGVDNIFAGNDEGGVAPPPAPQ